MITTLINTLNQVGKPPTLWTSTDGTRVLVLPYGGRILGLFTPSSDVNFFWTHPALRSAEPARAFYESADWHNSGGERTWLSPEIDFFLPNYPSLETYFQPREFDPGSYELKMQGDQVTLENRFTSMLSRSKQSAEIQITKRLGPAANPLRELNVDDLLQLRYAGFALDTRLEILQNSAALELNLWSLLQLPHGGDLIVPTYSRAEIMHFMGTISDSDLEATDQFVRYKMHAHGENKIGISPLWPTGRVGYLFRNGAVSSLIIRNIVVNPSAKYLDRPWNTSASTGAAIQACSIDSNLGAFSELEYHAPAIGGSNGLSVCEDSSQVWAFSGPEVAIAQAARVLLCPTL